MSDTSNTTVTIGDRTVIIFNNRKPDAFAYADIYDPTDPSSGKYIPTLYSLVIKDDGSLWYVSAQDSTTYKSTLTPCTLTTSSESGGSTSADVAVVNYGNDKYCIYVDTRTRPYKVMVDAKFLVYGNNLVEYALYRTNEEGVEECISAYYDSAGQFHSNRIPLASISEKYPAYRYPTNCHTTYELTEGEPVTIRIFNNVGNLSAEATLFVRNAIWWNDLESSSNPIVSLNARCLQMRGDDFYIYAQQDPSHLNIVPYLTYADGSTKDLNIDNKQTFMYGLEDYIPTYPGKQQTLIFKYFLNYREDVSGEFTNDNGTRFLSCSKELVVLNNDNRYVVKLSTIPLWDSNSNSWKLRFFAYNDERNTVYDVTDLVKINSEFPFDGTVTNFGKEQHLVFDYDLQSIFATDDEIPASQTLYLTVRAYDQYERYTFRDSSDSTHIYGVDGSITRRPILWYDDTIAQYFIPTSIFGNVDAVIESFYHLANPPYNANVETQAPTPTHFVVRNPNNGQQLIGGPIPLSEYGQSWPMIIGSDNYTGSTVLFEMLQETGNGNYAILYGVPVDVVAGTFNTESN